MFIAYMYKLGSNMAIRERREHLISTLAWIVFRVFRMRLVSNVFLRDIFVLDSPLGQHVLMERPIIFTGKLLLCISQAQSAECNVVELVI